ncbi:hypothetical protein RN001_013747 [Aquatica leii]|uniref:CHK kinase-like domain-containing protein n=1 Tax=Aquatica leii TaxID=1421715 RepID=A0AAN7PS53_9COLE|nr:hypothetical protein RN001_013747 [Aquatica leii]
MMVQLALNKSLKERFTTTTTNMSRQKLLNQNNDFDYIPESSTSLNDSESEVEKKQTATAKNKKNKSNINIISTDVSYVVPPGENYVCELLRIVVKFSEKDRNGVQSASLIVKRLLENELVQKFNEEMGFFSCEFSIYRCILPMIEKLGLKEKIAPKKYYASMEPENIIVIQDLSALHYKMANRQEGLNLEHCLLAIKKLAYFHAFSLALYEKYPKTMDQFNKGMLSKTEAFEQYFSTVYQGTVNACKREPCLQKYYDKINKDMKEKLFSSVRRDSKFNVLNHGDFWCNNLMFQYNANGSLEDVLFVDFQVSVFASPLYDLHYFIATSTNLEVKEKHIDEIVYYYYNELVKNVKILKTTVTVPSWKDFEKEFCNKAYMGFTSLIIGLPIIKANKRNDATVTNLLTENDDEDSFHHHCFTNSNYLTAIKFLLPYYDSLGVFDN